MIDIDDGGCVATTLIGHLASSVAEAVRAQTEAVIASRIKVLQSTIDPATFPTKPEAALVQSKSMSLDFIGFNGQFIRSSILLHLIKSLSIDVFIETGTFQGETCLLVAAQTRARVLSCDLVESGVKFVKMALAPFGERIQVAHEDSRSFLERILADKSISLPFLYLDAHWYSDLPLLGELERIFDSREEFVIVIDDFRVPHDDGFGFDRYGNVALEWDFIAPIVLKHRPVPSVWYPSYPAHWERNHKRGFILLASSSLEEVISTTIPSSLLRRAVV